MTPTLETMRLMLRPLLRFPVLRAPKAVGNIASRRISEKSGMRLVATEERDYVSGRFLAEIGRLLPRNGGLAAAHQDPLPRPVHADLKFNFLCVRS